MPAKQSVGEKLAGMATMLFVGGCLLVIWSGIWITYMLNHRPTGDGAYYWAGGIFLSGVTLILGATLSGPLGRAARQADMNPDLPATPAPTPENPNPVAQGIPNYTAATTEAR